MTMVQKTLQTKDLSEGGTLDFKGQGNHDFGTLGMARLTNSQQIVATHWHKTRGTQTI